MESIEYSMESQCLKISIIPYMDIYESRAYRLNEIVQQDNNVLYRKFNVYHNNSDISYLINQILEFAYILTIIQLKMFEFPKIYNQTDTNLLRENKYAIPKFRIYLYEFVLALE